MERRDFIKIVITGSLASSLGCRGGASGGTRPAAEAAGGAAAPETSVRAEINAFCHAVRDGAEFKRPRPARHVPVVIVGGGAAGLAAAEALGTVPALLIEKEPTLGGNATGGSWRGVGYSSGTSYNAAPVLKELAAGLKVPLLPIDSVDGMIVNDIFVPDFFTTGLRRAPYPQAVRDAFRRFLDTYHTYDVDAELPRLDNLPFAEILKDYPKEITDFFDSYGPNNWGARVRDTSAYIGLQAAQWMGGLEPGRVTGEQGFGNLTRAMGERLLSRGREGVLTGATVVRVERDRDLFIVTYVPPGSDRPAEGTSPATGPVMPPLASISADAVVMAAPKLIVKYIVPGLPKDQQDAMFNFRYIPYMVANLCFDGVVHDSCFDTDVPAPDLMSDVICADWVTRRGRGDRSRPTVLSCYMPQTEEDRHLFLEEADVRARALAALDRIDRWFPGAAEKCREIQVRLRGHPMHLATCGMVTKWAPLARRPFGAMHFAGTDGLGEVSDLAGAVETGRHAAQGALASIDAAARRRGARGRGAAAPVGAQERPGLG
ncbi:MAG TPA: FAD-dependent oxidoreductase [Candidatus Polarisedimenticolia bacterium]